MCADTASTTTDPAERSTPRPRRAPPRAHHAIWEPPDDRADPVAILEDQATTRVAELLPIRYGRMAASPFAFYRGAAAIMAADLAATPVTGLEAQLCGDAHMANFGIFAAPDRRLVFDVNDFDETHPGPWEWDVKRLAGSIAVLGRERGIKRRRRRELVTAAVGGYREEIRRLAGMNSLDVWYLRAEAEAVRAGATGSNRGRRRDVDAALTKARRRNNAGALRKLTTLQASGPRIVSDPPLIVSGSELLDWEPAESLHSWADEVFERYRASLEPHLRRLLVNYRLTDVARKVVGVGSVGLESWIALLIGDAGDPLFLQLKEAQRSVLDPHVRATVTGSQGRRVVLGQQLMQAAGDELLGWVSVADALNGAPRDYYVRQFWDGKASPDLDRLGTDALGSYARLCGAALARAHARSGDRRAIAAYLGAGDRFDRAVADFAETYAVVTEHDHAALCDAIASGRVTADPEH